MAPDDEEARSRLEQAADLFVFAPIGLASDARRLLPDLAQRGRNQVKLARMVGKFAMDQAGGKAFDAFCAVTGRSAPVEEEREDAPPADVGADAPGGAEGGAAGERPMWSDRREAQLDASSLPIMDYDSLSASQVVPRLDNLGPEELEAVRTYEQAMRARRTILAKIAQLQGLAD